MNEFSLVDGHVHIHACFHLPDLLDASSANFRSAAVRLGSTSPYVGILLLADGPSESGFDRILSLAPYVAGSESSGDWRLERTVDETSVILRSDARAPLICVAGRQIRSKEKLEVLAIGTRRAFTDGRSADELIHDVSEAGALPVIPWGFGKWAGARGRILRHLLTDTRLPSFFVGDNGNRPGLWPKSELFRLAAERGICDVPGSDPFPIPGEYRRVGTYGFAARGSISLTEPTKHLHRLLLDRASGITPYGKRMPFHRFMHNQLAIRVNSGAA